jgi:putative Mg2+ transporter-C (MgtC) family protein
LGDTVIVRLGAAPEVLRADPLRVVEAVITGVSFLGAGTIFRRSDSDHIEGLTTAASLLFVAVVGICTALGEIGTAVILTLLAWVVLRSGIWLEGRFQKLAPPSTSLSGEDG